MDCKFRILTKDKETFKKLKEYASGWSENFIIIDSKCCFFEFLKNFNIEMIITPFRAGEGEIDCFYYESEIKNCNKEILEKFDMSKLEPISWKNMEDKDVPF